MSERRPHWDDELIEAVRYNYNLQMSYADKEEELASIYDVIAAVEDWHEKFVMHGAFRVLAERAANADRLALDAEAAIARVRDMCDTIVKNSHRFQDAWDEDPTAAQVPYGQAMVARHILQALDGERDE